MFEVQKSWLKSSYYDDGNAKKIGDESDDDEDEKENERAECNFLESHPSFPGKCSHHLLVHTIISGNHQFFFC